MDLIKYLNRVIVNWLADVLPNECSFQKYFGIQICRLNPWYNQVMATKLKRLGY
jgi:hypothetical protein